MSSQTKDPTRIAVLRVGGWENWVETVTHYLSNQGFEVTPFVFEVDSDRRIPLDSSLPIVHELVTPGKLGKIGIVIKWGTKLRKHLAKGRFDILYVFDSWSIPTLCVATAGRLTPPTGKLVYHTFEWLDPRVHNQIHLRLEKMICRRADLVVNIDRTRGRLQQMLYSLPACLLWVRNSLSRDYPIPARSVERRAELLGRNPPSNSVLIFAPSITSQERLTLQLVQAAARMPDHYRVATIAGGDAYFNECVETAKSLGIAHRMVFLPTMPFRQLMEYVVCADIGVVLHDGSKSIGNYLASPMRLSVFAAAGVPFIVSDLPTLAGEVYRYRLGASCNEQDPASICNVLRELVEADTPMPVWKQRSRQTFEENLSFDIQGERLVNALVQLGEVNREGI